MHVITYCACGLLSDQDYLFLTSQPINNSIHYQHQIEESMQLLELQLICKWSGYHVLHRLPLGLAVMVFVMSLPGTHGVSFARLVGFDLNKSSPPLYVLPLMSNEVYRSGQPRRKTCNTYLHLLFFSSKNNPLSMSNAPHISSVGQRLG